MNLILPLNQNYKSPFFKRQYKVNLFYKIQTMSQRQFFSNVSRRRSKGLLRKAS